jgi:serine/threonine-protein kinase
MARCPKCDADAPGDVGFCGECGAPIAPGETVPGEPASAALQLEQAPALAVGIAPTAASVPSSARAAPKAAKPTRPPGALVDRKYEIVRLLGEGGMGVVYLAKDVHTGTDVVLKAVRADLAHRADIRERTMDEGRALARIDHPNVVHLNAVVAEGDELWLVMQYVEGQSLDKVVAGYVAEHRPMPLDEALRLFRQIALGIAAAHAEGVIHRDLKPANVLVRRKDGVAKVTDFGIAKSAADAREGRIQTKGIIGSVWYMSPEQVTGRRDLDRRVDVYALGILLYELLVGRVPFDAESDYDIMRMQAEAPLPLVATQRADVPAALDALLQKACAKDRDARFESCEELLVALDAAARPPSEPPRPSAAEAEGADAIDAAAPARPGRSKTVWIGGLVGVATLALGVGLAASGVLPGTESPARTAASARLDGVRATTSTRAPATSAKPPPSPLEALVGAWQSENGNAFDAVIAGDAVEFRVHDPKQLAEQGYLAGEPRFTLHPIAGEPGEFTVEDRIRPLPPVGAPYDAGRARTTCFETFTTVAGKSLTASLEGARLRVEAAKIEPTAGNFVREGDKVVSCRGLAALRPSAIVVLLARRAP